MLTVNEATEKVNEASEKLTEIKHFLEQREAEFEDFEKRMRENVKNVSSEEYGNLINDTYAKFEEEHKIISEVSKMRSEINNEIFKSDPNYFTEKLEKLSRILSHGLDEVTKCQRRIIVKSENIKHEYVQKLEDEVKQIKNISYSTRDVTFRQRLGEIVEWSDMVIKKEEEREKQERKNKNSNRYER